MRHRSSIKGFKTFYGTHYVGKGGKLKKKQFVAARGEWSGAPELGMKSKELRSKSKKSGMTMNQYRAAERKRRRNKNRRDDEDNYSIRGKSHSYTRAVNR